MAWSIAEPISVDEYRRLRRRMIFDHCKWDPQSGDHDVLFNRPIVLSFDDWSILKKTAEQLSVELMAAEGELLNRPDLYELLGLPREVQKLLLKKKFSPMKNVVRFMRFDFHLTSQGWLISEVNADVPGGFIEASAYTTLMNEYYPDHLSLGDPSAVLAEKVALKVGQKGNVALVHATSYADDRQVMEYLGKCFEVLGFRPFFVGPQHIVWDQGRAQLGGPWESIPLDAIVRFFPAEWLPNLPASSQWEHFFYDSLTVQANPASALLVQSKKFPLVWDQLDIPMDAWRASLPQAQDVRSSFSGASDWVIKPVFSRAGEGVLIRGISEEKDRIKIENAVRRSHRDWVMQKRFDPVPIMVDGKEHYPCFGVYVIDGVACGIYGRIASRPLIDHRAQDVAVFIKEREFTHA